MSGERPLNGQQLRPKAQTSGGAAPQLNQQLNQANSLTDPHVQAAEDALTRNDVPAAITAYQAAIAAVSKAYRDPEIDLALGDAYLRQGDVASAKNVYQAGMPDASNPWARGELWKFHLRLAITHAADASSSQSLQSALNANNHYSQGMQLKYPEATSENPDAPAPVVFWRVFPLPWSNYPDVARNISAICYAEIGGAASELGESEKALWYLQQSVNADSSSASQLHTLMSLASVYWALDRPENALDTYRITYTKAQALNYAEIVAESASAIRQLEAALAPPPP
jgi:tetratricopeptide (TPR) repeat protein